MVWSQAADHLKKDVVELIYEERTGKNIAASPTSDKKYFEGGSHSVQYDYKNGYLVLSFLNNEDYKLFVRGRGEKSIYEESGGTFHRALIIGKAEFHLPVLAIRDTNFEAYRVVDHEFQHFLNHVIFDFFRAENKGGNQAKKTLNEELHDQAIKDELLAYLRDGTLRDCLTSSDLYKHLNFTPKNKEIIRKFFGIIAENRDLFCDDRIRILMVYNLVDVSFPNLISRLETFSGLYRRIMSTFEVCDDVLSHPSTEGWVINSISKAKEEGLEQKRNEIISNHFRAKYIALGLEDGPRPNMTLADLKNWLSEQVEEFKSLKRQYLYRDNARLPFIKDYAPIGRINSLIFSVPDNVFKKTFDFCRGIPQSDINELVRNAWVFPEERANFRTFLVGLAKALKHAGIEEVQFNDAWPFEENKDCSISLKVTCRIKRKKYRDPIPCEFNLVLSAQEDYFKKQIAPVLVKQKMKWAA